MIEQIVQEWRDTTLKEVCRKCYGDCCAGNIPGLTEEQVRLIFNTDGVAPRNANNEPMFCLDSKDNTYGTNYKGNDCCPQLKYGKCEIYEHPLKPDVCKNYPIFIDHEHKSVSFMNMPCFATEFSYSKDLCVKILDLGYEIENAFGIPRKITKKMLELSCPSYFNVKRF